VYGWTPCDPSELCGNVRNAIIVHGSVINHEKEKHFFHNNLLFQHKFPKNFQGCQMKMSIFEYGPMVLREEIDMNIE
jgi:hypothetical protein